MFNHHNDFIFFLKTPQNIIAILKAHADFNNFPGAGMLQTPLDTVTYASNGHSIFPCALLKLIFLPPPHPPNINLIDRTMHDLFTVVAYSRLPRQPICSKSISLHFALTLRSIHL